MKSSGEKKITKTKLWNKSVVTPTQHRKKHTNNGNQVRTCVEKTVDRIWRRYDIDGNETLERIEMQQFVMDQLTENDERDGYREHDFEDCFGFIDKDGDGAICREELINFFLRIANLT